jgi:dTDP-L-rhamnose 4-epimerase
MKLLIAGGAGFIGSRVAAAALAAGHEVTLLDALLPSVHPDGAPAIPEGAHLIRGDVCDAETMLAALDGVDAVCHQAAKVGLGIDFSDAPDYVRHNDLGTATLLAAMTQRGICRLVLASSMVVYGEGAYTSPTLGPVSPPARTAADLDAGLFEPRCPRSGQPLRPELVFEDAPLDPRNVYAATKAMQEYLSAAWARDTGGRVAALRYHNVYGPRMPKDTPYAGVASIFRSALARGEAPQVFEDGGQRRDFISVDDVAAANLAALDWTSSEVGQAGQLRAFNVGSGQVHTIGDLAKALSAAAGGSEPVVTGRYRLGDVRHITASSQRLRDELGWAPAISFEAGMKSFAQEPLRGE